MSRGRGRNMWSWHPSVRRLALGASLAALLLGGPPGCRTTPNPVTGRPEVVLMSPEDERRIDAEQAAIVEAQEGLVPNERLQAYVRELGALLAEQSPRKDVQYHFAVIASPVPNAFALPGGHIYVTRGLMELSNSEAELANVLGHEIGHVAARHSAQRDAHAKTLGLSTLLSSIAGGGQEGDDGKVYEGVYGYTRNQEREADRIGQEIAVSAGIDPMGMSQFLRSLDSSVRLVQGFSTPEFYYASHPSTPERVAENMTSAQARDWTPSPGIAPRRLDYLQKIQNLEIGDPPSEGVMVDGRFVHPDLGFSIRMPRGWTVQNAHSHVAAISPGRDALVLLQLVGQGDDPERAALANAEQEGLSLSKQQRIRIGDLDAVRARTTLRGPFGPMHSEVTWVAFNGLVYRLAGGVSRGGFGPHEAAFRTYARSFRAVEPEELDRIFELRLEIAVARDGESIADISRRTGNQWPIGRTAVFNGLHVNERLQRGHLVKIAKRHRYVPKPAGEPDGPPPGEDPADSQAAAPLAWTREALPRRDAHGPGAAWLQ